MRILTRILLWTVVIALISATAWAASDEEARTAIAQAYAASEVAFNQRDMGRLVAMMTDDYKELLPDGRVLLTHDNYLAHTQQEMQAVKSFQLHITVDTVQVKGTTATATITSVLDYVWSAKGQEGHQSTRVTRRDSWVQAGDAWKLQLTHIVSSKTTDVK